MNVGRSRHSEIPHDYSRLAGPRNFNVLRGIKLTPEENAALQRSSGSVKELFTVQRIPISTSPPMQNPDNRSTVIPGMQYRKAPEAIEWLCTVFGFRKHAVDPGGNDTISHAELDHLTATVRCIAAIESFANLFCNARANG
jgi:hypothetical protein